LDDNPFSALLPPELQGGSGANFHTQPTTDIF
jgi:hypothetical protein